MRGLASICRASERATETVYMCSNVVWLVVGGSSPPLLQRNPNACANASVPLSPDRPTRRATVRLRSHVKSIFARRPSSGHPSP